jgi:copper homeostasis protein
MGERPRLEVCVDSPAGLMAAVEGGADRIELCAALALSGLTPSPGLMALAGVQATPIYAMIRPRAGDFVYSQLEIDVMRRDIDAARAAGLAGVVIGANRPSGALDAAALMGLIDHAAGLGVTLHRAFDLVPDFDSALELAIELGFVRILTSGGEATAIAGAATIRDLVAQAAGRISIMAGSGVTAANVAELVRRTGVAEVHGSCGGALPAASGRAVSLGFIPAGLRDTSGAKVAAMVQAVASLA